MMDTKPTSSVNEDPSKHRLKLLFIDITDYTKVQQFFICSFLVFIFYLGYGYAQELIFASPELSSHALYLTWIQFGYYILFGCVAQMIENQQERRVPWKTYNMIAILTVGTMACSNGSLRYLNYPTQVIFKSCKVIPVMIGSVIIQKKSYSLVEYFSAFLMSVGLIFFTLADSQLSPKFDIRGIIFISAALLCDAIIGNVQEKMMHQYHPSIAEIVLYSYFCGFLYILFLLVVTWQLWDSFMASLYLPVESYAYTAVFAFTGYFGVQAVLMLVQTCGAVIAVTLTTFRKSITIVLSFILIAKPFSFQYVWSGGLVLAGVLLTAYKKQRLKQKSVQPSNV